MDIIPDTERVPFAYSDLHPAMRDAVRAMVGATAAIPFTVNGARAMFEPFEGYRSPVRQQYLLSVMKTTKAGPWKSAHQYGLAVDFAVRVYYDGGKSGWAWPDRAPWSDLKPIAKSFGLRIPIELDRGHVVHPLWDDFRKVI